jgi:hypothetical protein
MSKDPTMYETCAKLLLSGDWYQLSVWRIFGLFYRNVVSVERFFAGKSSQIEGHRAADHLCGPQITVPLFRIAYHDGKNRLADRQSSSFQFCFSVYTLLL